MAMNWNRRGSSLATQSSYLGYAGGTSGSRRRATTSGTRRGASARGGTVGYKNLCSTLQNKINSYKCLFNETTGAARYPRPTPATLNSFTNWVNKGAIVQTVTPTQLSRWARLANKSWNPSNPTVSACRGILTARFGKTTIKAVCRAKNGQFLVATAPTWKGRPFTFPS